MSQLRMQIIQRTGVSRCIKLCLLVIVSAVIAIAAHAASPGPAEQPKPEFAEYPYWVEVAEFEVSYAPDEFVFVLSGSQCLVFYNHRDLVGKIAKVSKRECDKESIRADHDSFCRDIPFGTVDMVRVKEDGKTIRYDYLACLGERSAVIYSKGATNKLDRQFSCAWKVYRLQQVIAGCMRDLGKSRAEVKVVFEYQPVCRDLDYWQAIKEGVCALRDAELYGLPAVDGGRLSSASGHCGNGIVEPGEECDGGGVCCNMNTCTFESATTECRAAAGPCDSAETCTGSSSSCPADALMPAKMICWGTEAGVGYTACTGTSAECPSRRLIGNTKL